MILSILAAVTNGLAIAACDVVLYVSSDFNHEVPRYNAATGQFQQTFIPVGANGPLDQPHGILERDADVLVASPGSSTGISDSV